jgi:hypothetical protein
VVSSWLKNVRRLNLGVSSFVRVSIGNCQETGVRFNKKLVCKIGGKALLCDPGTVEYNSLILRVGLREQRFRYYNGRRENPDAYPFHCTCWHLLLANDSRAKIQDNIDIMYDIFDSIYSPHDDPRGGHDYLLKSSFLFEGVNQNVFPEQRPSRSILVDPMKLDLQRILSEAAER